MKLPLKLSRKALPWMLLAIVLVPGAVAVWISFEDGAGDSLWGYGGESRSYTDRVRRFEHRDGSVILRVALTRDVDDSAAAALIREKLFLFGSLFEQQRVGYQGQHTEFVECGERFKPRRQSRDLADGRLEFFRTFANTRLTHGACDEDSTAFRSINGFLYCPEQRILADIEYFEAIDSADGIDAFLARIDCRFD